MALEKLNNFLGSNVGGVVTGAVSQGIGMLGENARYKRNLAGSKELMGIQDKNQRGLNVQGHNLQYDMWKKTNYPAQIEMMKEAGLNPALMYGQAGAGGQTGSQGGGSAASGQAPQQYQPMDMQNLMMGAQIANLNANTKKTEAEAENEAGGTKNVLKAQYDKLVSDKKFQDQLKKTEVEKTEVERLKKEAEQMNVDSMNTAGWTEGDAIWVKSAKQYANTLVEGGKMTAHQAKEWLANVVQEFFEDGPVSYDPNNPNHNNNNHKTWKSNR